MTNEQKANELPEDLIDLFRPLYREISDLCRKGHNLNGRKISQSDASNILGKARQIAFEYKEKSLTTLSGTPEEAEEVLNPYVFYYRPDFQTVEDELVKAEDALKAMQTLRAAGETKVHAYYQELSYENIKLEEQVESLQQQLSEKDKEMSAEMQSLKQLEREKEIEDAHARGIEQGIEQYQRELREELQKIGKLHFSIPDKEKEQYKEQIHSLQQQLSEMNEQSAERMQNIFELKAQNQRLTAEVERYKKIMDAIKKGIALKEAIKPLFDENPEVQGDSETIDKKSNHKWIRGYRSYKCEICGEFANTGIDNL